MDPPDSQRATALLRARRTSYFDLGFATRSTDDYLAEPDLVRSSAGLGVAGILDDARDAINDLLGAQVQYPPVLPCPSIHIYLGRMIVRFAARPALHAISTRSMRTFRGRVASVAAHVENYFLTLSSQAQESSDRG
jgi:hypothetical protein